MSSKSKYRFGLPQSETPGDFFLTDGGLETVLVFDKQIDLPDFAAFPLLNTSDGRSTLTEYAKTYLDLAADYNCSGFVLETPTWRASPDYVARRTGSDATRIKDTEAVNQLAVAEAIKLREEYEAKFGRFQVVVSGNVGPRGDGYSPKDFMDAEQAEEYHKVQIGALSDAGVDVVTCVTLTYPEEAVGIARACAKAGVKCVVGFTVETDGTLPCGSPLGSAVRKVNEEWNVEYFMVNCAHTDHFLPVLREAVKNNEKWVRRVRGLRCNGSRKSHAELDSSPELDCGDPEEFGTIYRAVRIEFPWINVMGGCCGTDARHAEEICKNIMGRKK